jgi:hypothetical protein
MASKLDVLKFLASAFNMVKKGDIKNLDDLFNFAKQQFGQVDDKLSKQITDTFEKGKVAAVTEKRTKDIMKRNKEEVEANKQFEETKNLLKEQMDILNNRTKDISMGDPTGERQGRIKTLLEKMKKEMAELEKLDTRNKDLTKDLQDLDKQQTNLNKKLRDAINLSKDPPKLDSRENIMGAIDKLKNPRRPGGPLDPVIGVTRTLARRVLEKRNIEIGKKDPIDIYSNTFGESITDLKNLGEEIVEAEQAGRNLKPVDDLLEIEGFFDIEIPKNPNKGIPNKEMIEKLEKDLKEKEILEDFDTTFRKPNATGGLTRTSYAMGKGPVLPSDEDPINPFQPKPIGPVLPDKSMMADLGDEFLSPEYEDEFRKFLMMLEESDRKRSMDNIMEMFKKYMLSKEPRVMEAATGGRVQAASGGLAYILKV